MTHSDFTGTTHSLQTILYKSDAFSKQLCVYSPLQKNCDLPPNFWVKKQKGETGPLSPIMGVYVSDEVDAAAVTQK